MYSTTVVSLACLMGMQVGAQANQAGLQRDEMAGGPRAAVAVMNALRLTVPPAVDGHLDEPAWRDALTSRPFIQRHPEPGASSILPTEIGVVYTRDAVFVAMRLVDPSPDSIGIALSRRDVATDQSDWAHVYLDSFNDRRTAFRFSVNPAGVKLDALHYDDTSEDLSWDAVWDVATEVGFAEWTAEFRIPLSQLRFAGGTENDVSTWGVNFGRQIARYGETSYWAPITPDNDRFVSAFGTMTLRGLRAPRRLEITPYSVMRLTAQPGAPEDPFHSPTAATAGMGADLRYGLASDFTLSLSLNPDFGQVESDPSVVNLSAFETVLPEKRPFFLEGTDLFGLTFPEWPSLFYSRRVGRAPRGSAPSQAEFADAPEATTILGAAKLTGKTPGGLAVGAVTAYTGPEFVTYVDTAGRRGRQLVEPPTSYSVGRLIQQFRDGESAIGAIITGTNRFGDADALGLHRSAYVAGVDGRHRLSSGTWEMAGSLVASRVDGSEKTIARTQRASSRYLQRPDADHLTIDTTRRSLSGFKTGLQVARIGGGHLRAEISGQYISPGFEVNDLGLQTQVDRISWFSQVGWDEFHPAGPVRRWRLNLNAVSGWSTGGERLYTWSQLYGDAQLRNFWQLDFGLDRTFSGLSTSALRGGPALFTAPYLASWFGVRTDSRRPVSGGLSGFVSAIEGGGGRVRLAPFVAFQPSARINARLQPSVTRNRVKDQYVGTHPVGEETVYLVGSLDQMTAALTARLNYTFSPALSLEIYGQPFISAGRYPGFRRVRVPRAAPLAERLAPVHVAADGDQLHADIDGDGESDFSFARPDFTSAQFRSNVVFRWEYRPGSTLFLVWAQDLSAFDGDGRFALDRGISSLSGAEGTNVLLAKVTYWFDR